MKNKYKSAVTIFIGISIALKTIFLFASGAYLNPQPYEYEEAASNLLNGRGFYYVNFETKYYAGIEPGFPILCFLVYKLFGHHPILIIFGQILVTSFLVLPISLIARRIFDEKTAILAALLVALYPPLIVYSTSKLHTMSVYSFLFAVFVLSFLELRKSLTISRIVFVGLVAGLSLLFRATSIVFLILGISWFYFVSREKSRKKLHAICLISLLFLFMLMPWGIRNYMIFKKPILMQTNKGEALWYGNMPGSNGSLYTEGGVTLFEKAASQLPAEFFEMDELERGKYLARLTIGYFKDDPQGFIGRIFKKLYYFWYFSPHQGSLYPKSWMKLYKVYYLGILFPAIFSVARLFFLKNGDRSDAVLIGILFFTLTFVHSLYFVEARHRWSVEPLLLIFTANGIIIAHSLLFKSTR